MADDCFYCKGEPKIGWIEQMDNGPIVPCPVCNPKTQREIEYDRALMAIEPRCDCGHLFEICGAPDKCW